MTVDDRLPCINSSLCFSRCHSPTAFWVALLEKAYAKLVTGGIPLSYLSSLCTTDIVLLPTPAEEVFPVVASGKYPTLCSNVITQGDLEWLKGGFIVVNLEALIRNAVLPVLL